MGSMLFLAYEVQIPEVDEIAGQISQDKDRVLPVYGINEKDQPSGKAEIPEGDRNKTGLLSFGFNPLDKKPHGEHRLADEADNDPEVNLERVMLPGER